MWTAPGKQAGNKQKSDENTRVPDLRDAAQCASSTARYILAWDIFCIVILGTISRLVNQGASGPLL